jgi:hypothetical protein
MKLELLCTSVPGHPPASYSALHFDRCRARELVHICSSQTVTLCHTGRASSEICERDRASLFSKNKYVQAHGRDTTCPDQNGTEWFRRHTYPHNETCLQYNRTSCVIPCWLCAIYSHIITLTLRPFLYLFPPTSPPRMLDSPPP